MANANGSKPNLNAFQRAVLALFGMKQNGFVSSSEQAAHFPAAQQQSAQVFNLDEHRPEPEKYTLEEAASVLSQQDREAGRKIRERVEAAEADLKAEKELEALSQKYINEGIESGTMFYVASKVDVGEKIKKSDHVLIDTRATAEPGQHVLTFGNQLVEWQGKPENYQGVAIRVGRDLVEADDAELTPLQTQKDGRLFAIELIRKLENIDAAGGNDCFLAVEYEQFDGERLEARGNRQQSDLVRRAFDAIYEATEEARLGFFNVFTDQFGTAPAGWLHVEAWEKRVASGELKDLPEMREEQEAGLNQDFGTPGSEAKGPEGAPAPSRQQDNDVRGLVENYLGCSPEYRENIRLFAAESLNQSEQASDQEAGAGEIPGSARQQAPAKERRQSEAEKKAAGALRGFASEVYALDDMARRLVKSPLSTWTTYQAVKGLVAALQSRLNTAAVALPEKHKARKIIAGNALLLEAVREFILNAEDGSGEWNTPKETLGVGMLALVRGIGREFERAVIACGGRESAGYLIGDDSDPCAVEK